MQNKFGKPVFIMTKFDISVILPSISPSNWIALYNQIVSSVGKYKCEVLAVGPYFPPKELENKSDFRYIQCFSCPSVCLQQGAYLSYGKYITWFPDDCTIEPLALEKCIDFLNNESEKDGMTVRYSEGPNYSGTQHLDYNYWTAWTHEDLRLPKVNKDWRIAPIFIYNLSYFRELGGLNTGFEHINMNCHELAFAVQQLGGKMHLSPVKVFSTNWHPWTNVQSQKSPIQLAYEENDKPLFDRTFKQDSTLGLKIDFDNWRNADAVWKRRFREE